MLARVLLLAGLAALAVVLLRSGADDTPPPAASPAPAARPPEPEPELEPEPEPEPKPDRLIAERSYEMKLGGRRAGILLVTWTRAEHEGEPALRDVTRTLTRTTRVMGQVEDVFETNSRTTILRTLDGDLLRQEDVVVQGGREDRTVIRRTNSGYRVERSVNGNEESFDVETEGPTKVDVEAYLGPRIRDGELRPGDTFSYRVLAPARRTSLKATATVEEDDEPGLRVRVSLDGLDSLWHFAPDGSVLRMTRGDLVVLCADGLTFEDLPPFPAPYPITLPANVALPRVFTARSMIVDVDVRTDETVRPPRIPANPYTEVVEETESRVRLRLKSYDSPKANVRLPIDPKGFEKHLAATPLMEIEDPALQRIARAVLSEHDDARGAAAAIADFVFRKLRKGSSDTAEPTATQILRDGGGDCSEHALLFTALCRAAGIPARRCSGFVCIGEDWGGHAWCEIWVGEWIGVDPTTNEIGTRARYIFCGRQDGRAAELHPARTRILIREAEFDDGKVVIGEKPDRAVFTGVRLGALPEGWRVMSQHPYARQRTIVSDTVRIDVVIEPDHGYRAVDLLLDYYEGGFIGAVFAGRDAIVRKAHRNTSWIVPLGRQNLWVMATTRGEVPAERIEEILRPTLERDDW